MHKMKMIMGLVVFGTSLFLLNVEAGNVKEAPTVTINSPVTGAVFSKGEIVPVVVEYKASSGKLVTQLQLLVDDENNGLPEIIAPPKETGGHTFRLDTLPISLGEHTIKVSCQETGSGKGEASVQINIEATTARIALGRLDNNYSKIQDMQGSYIDEAVISNQKSTPVRRQVWLKPPDKSKIVSPEGTMITDGSKITIIRPGKEPQEIDSSDYFPTTTATQMDFIYHRDEFVEKHTVNILSENNGIIEIEAIPKSEDVLYSKLKLKVDLTAGVEKEVEVYNEEGSLIHKTEVLSYRKVGEVNLPTEKRETYYLDEGEIINTTRLGEVGINTGISDDEFK